MKKIIITGGHLTPALAVIEELKSRKDWQVYYLGRKYSQEGIKIPSEESNLISQTGTKFVPIIAGRLQRKFTRYTIPSLLRVPFAFIQSFCLVWRIKPDIILSFGSYVSVPVVFVGWLLKIPVVSHEQTVTVGLANKINAIFSTLVAVSYKECLDLFPKNKAVFTGNPLRKEVFLIKKSVLSEKVTETMEILQLPLIYVTGGSQGARPINKLVKDSLSKLLKRFLVIHQTGSLESKKILADFRFLPTELASRYFIESFIDSGEIGWVLAKASLVISRAGANIIWELGALGKPAILIPLPIAGGQEQFKNALRLRNLGLAEVIDQDELSSEKLLRVINKILTNYQKYSKAGERTSKLFTPDGAKNLVDKIYELLENRRQESEKW